MMVAAVDEPDEPPEVPGPVLRAGALALDRRRATVTVGGTAVALTRTEFLLLAALLARPGDAMGHRALVAAIWGTGPAAEGRMIDVSMRHLRGKLQRAAAAAGVAPPVIETVPTVGYRLRP